MARDKAVIRQVEDPAYSTLSTYLGGIALGGAATRSSALPLNYEDYAGLATINGKPIYNQQQVIGQLDTGRVVPTSNGTISFSFLTGPTAVGIYNNKHNDQFGATQEDGYSPFSTAQKIVARESMALWDDLIPQTIVEKKGLGADIIFANTTTGPAQAEAYYPGNGAKIQSDVWIASPEVNWTNGWLNYNGYGRTSIIHEAGHALGLSHPGDYNFGDDNDGDGEPDPITYAGDAFYFQDSEQYSIMSYFDPRLTGATPLDVEVGLLGNAQTPLLHDILTIQAKYGADPTTRVGNTTYGFNSNAGKDVYDFSSNQTPYLSIYDAGGIDTLDLSGADSGVFLDLRPGHFSSAAVRPTLAEANDATAVFNAATDAVQGDFAPWTQASLDAYLTAVGTNRSNQINAMTGEAGVRALSHQNISIAYNTIIENAVGGSQRDYLVGNHVANKLTGNGGDDTIRGLGGDDILSGGAGNDRFVYGPGEGGTDTITDFDSGADKIDLRELVGVTASDVTFQNGKLFVDVDNTPGADLTIIVQGEAVNLGSDILFG